MIVGEIKNPPDNDAQEGYFISPDRHRERCRGRKVRVGIIFLAVKAVLYALRFPGMCGRIARAEHWDLFVSRHYFLSEVRQAGPGGWRGSPVIVPLPSEEGAGAGSPAPLSGGTDLVWPLPGPASGQFRRQPAMRFQLCSTFVLFTTPTIAPPPPHFNLSKGEVFSSSPNDLWGRRGWGRFYSRAPPCEASCKDCAPV